MNLSDTIITCQYSDAPVMRPLEQHDAFEMGFVKAGSVKARIAKETYILQSPALFFISQFENHSFYPKTSIYERYYILFTSKSLEKLVDDPRLLSVFRNRAASFRHGIPLKISPASVEICFETMLEEYRHNREYSFEVVQASLRQLLVIAFREYPDNFVAPSSKMQIVIYEVQKYLEENYQKEIRIADVAKDRFINPYHLSHTFKAYTGFSPKQYLRSVRLSRARGMLLTSDCSVTAISNRCGFSDVNNFIRAFRQEHKVTPLQYKKQQMEQITLLKMANDP